MTHSLEISDMTVDEWTVVIDGSYGRPTTFMLRMVALAEALGFSVPEGEECYHQAAIAEDSERVADFSLELCEALAYLFDLSEQFLNDWGRSHGLEFETYEQALYGRRLSESR